MPNDWRLLYVNLHVGDLAAARDFYENSLGFEPIAEGPGTVSYPAGHALLCLDRAADAGVPPPQGRDRSIAVTFLIDDIDEMRAALEARGARLPKTLVSPAGSMIDFYDPDGHWLSLYQPSGKALGWPSAAKVRALRSAPDGRPSPARSGLNDHDVLYLFLFVDDLAGSSAFYHEGLGFQPIEVTTCNRGVTSLADGVVKYDVGGTMLTTHHVGDAEHAALHKVTTKGSGGLAVGFHVPDLDAAADELARAGLDVTRGTGPLGAIASFDDPGGHVYHLAEVSEAALARPGGDKMRHIVTASL